MERDQGYTWVTPHLESIDPSITKLSSIDQTNPRFYTQPILCFPTSTSTSIRAVCASLKASLARTLSDIPFLVGRLEPQEHDRKSGRLLIITSRSSGVAFYTRELMDQFSWTYADFKSNGYPIQHLDPDILTPVDSVATDPSPPVMAVQANFVVGGLLLVICIHHAAMDASGLGTVLQTWARHNQDIASDLPFDPKVLPELLDRSVLTPTGTRFVDLDDHPQYTFLNQHASDGKSDSMSLEPMLPFPSMTSKIFHFAPDQLVALKTDAMPLNPSEGWISAHDAICALLWKAIVSARDAQHIQGELQTSTLSFAVDGRRKIRPALSTAYLGNMNIYTSITRVISSILTIDIGTLAIEVRQAIDRLDDDGYIRDIIELLDSAPVVTDVHTGGKHFLGKDVAVTSWAALPLHGLGWGPVVGKVERVRVPYASFDGLCIVLPRLEDGSLEVIIGLMERHMKRLIEGDGEFGRFANVIE